MASDQIDATVLAEVAQLEAIAEEWDACLATMAGSNPFLTNRWLVAWTRANAVEHDLRVVVLRRGGELVAAAPLVRRRARYYGIPVTEIVWIGTRTSDRLQFVLRDDEPALARALWREVTAHARGADIVRLEEVPEASATARAVRDGGGLVGHETSSRLPWVPVSDWPEYEMTLQKKFRSEMRTRVKVFAKWGEWRLSVVTGAAVADRLDAMAALETAGQKGAGGYAFLADARNRAFLRDVIAAPDAAVTPVLLGLEVDGTLVAYLFGLVHGGSFCAYNIAFEPGREKGSPGKWLCHQAMKWSGEQGLAEFDFLRGAHAMKARWKPNERRSARLVRFRRDPLGLALHAAVFRLRPWLKRHGSRR